MQVTLFLLAAALSATAAALFNATAALPPLNSIVFITPSGKNTRDQSLRHCSFSASFDPYDGGNDDFAFTLIDALNGAPNAVSFRSVNYPAQYLSLKADGLPSGFRIGIVATPDVSTASWTATSTGKADGGMTLTTLSTTPGLSGRMLTISTNSSGPCNLSPQKPDAVLSPPKAGQDAASQSFLIGARPSPGPSPSPPPPPPMVPATISVDATSVDHVLNPAHNGCHVDVGFANDPMAWTSTLIYGQGFVNGPTSIRVPAWYDVTTAAGGSAALDPSVIMNPNVVPPAPTLKVDMGGSTTGFAGWASRGIGGEGLVFEAAKDYEGYVMILVPAGGPAATLSISMNDRTTNTTLATTSLQVSPSPTWQRITFSGLTPSAPTTCTGIPWDSDPTVDCGEPPKAGMNPGIVCVKCGGEVTFGVTSGSAHLGFVTLEPGSWGRFQDQPVLKSGTDMIQRMGFKSIRQGGSVSYSLRWKDWRGAPEQRAAMNHIWGPDLVAPWGPFEFIDMANALDIMPIVTLACDLDTAEDWGDLVEYMYGDDSTPWGAVRIHNDSHPLPYRCDTFELGNEQQNPDFVAQIKAIEARRATIPGAPEWYFMYPENSGPNASQLDAIVASGVQGNRVMADCHVGYSGGVACAEASLVWQKYNGSGINCETNAVTSHLQRGTQEPADVSSRLRARTASFCTQRSGQSRDIWDQGLSFFLPNATWLQPPGVVHEMIAATWQPNALKVTVTGGDVDRGISSAAQVSQDGKTLNVMIANNDWGAVPGNVTLSFTGFQPSPTFDFWLMAEPGSGAVNTTTGNTPANPEYIKAVKSSMSWPSSGPLNFAVPPLSFAILVLTSA